jgi:uncharacterized protein YlxP (DUF503 family)
MVLGVCQLQLILPENHSLKGKRSVVRSICARVRQTFNVAIAEVGEQDVWQVAELGFVVVSTDGRHADRMVAEIVDFIERRAEAQLGTYKVEQLVV